MPEIKAPSFVGELLGTQANFAIRGHHARASKKSSLAGSKQIHDYAIAVCMQRDYSVHQHWCGQAPTATKRTVHSSNSSLAGLPHACATLAAS